MNEVWRARSVIVARGCARVVESGPGGQVPGRRGVAEADRAPREGGSTRVHGKELAVNPRYAGALRGYLRSETIAPLPLQRLAAAHPDTVDAVFRKILRRRDFTWAEHGAALMRRRKAWYNQHEPLPGVSVIGARLFELASGSRR